MEGLCRAMQDFAGLYWAMNDWNRAVGFVLV